MLVEVDANSSRSYAQIWLVPHTFNLPQHKDCKYVIAGCWTSRLKPSDACCCNSMQAKVKPWPLEPFFCARVAENPAVSFSLRTHSHEECHAECGQS